MANCNKLFLDFNNDLRPDKKKRDRISTSREELRRKIRSYFIENHPDYTPYFWIQGSANQRINTVILYKDNTCDLDDGIYFFGEIAVSAKTLQGWVKDAVEGVTKIDPIHKRKCIRVIYQDDYHIDLPVYNKLDKADQTEIPNLADKNDGFSESDPKAFAEWFHEQKDDDRQLVRIVKYLKDWGDNIRNKMPTGLALTLLAVECFSENERDDIALNDTLKKIKDKLDNSWVLTMPTSPYDDLFSSYDDDKKKYIIDKLSGFISDAKSALDEPNQLKASKLWQKHLGDRFPNGKDEDVEAKEKALLEKASILASTPYVKKDGEVTSNRNEGKLIPDTKNYGGKVY
ncbi:MAG: hypothetical protein JJ892_11985 [Balneola sp.]|nr:hypothetical protein [Balneola sp.]MBO6651445.1 hypothetical protein [Balneola sp.]MBO6712518.1 hypothetical protein [Balneola sp.]MBO6800989.1 hypothetical protein [Balneola sp.]MBO6870661.1 hypothetical protein [Balneola sp.]